MKTLILVLALALVGCKENSASETTLSDEAPIFDSADALGGWDYQQGWAMKFQRERDALQAKCDAYETALEEIKRRTHFDEAEGPELRAQNAANYRAACTVLAAHKRPTKEAADE